MRSFRLYNPHAIVPERLASEYSNVEKEAFGEAFKRQAEHYRVKRKKAKRWANVFFFICGTAVVCFPAHSVPLFVCFGIAGVLAWLCVAVNYPRALNCPGCHQNLLEGFGKFCPECAGKLAPVSF